MISYDRTQRSVVASCTCGWREIGFDKAEAERAAMHHVYVAHAADELLRMERRRTIQASYQRNAYRRDTPR